MKPISKCSWLVVAVLLLAGCATRPVNPPLAKYEPAPPLLDRPGQTAAEKEELIWQES